MSEVINSFPIQYKTAEEVAESLRTTIGAAADVEVDSRRGFIENFGGLKEVQTAFIKLEAGTGDAPRYVGIASAGDSMAGTAYFMRDLLHDLGEIWGVGAWVSPNLSGFSSGSWVFTGGASVPNNDFTLTPGNNWIRMPSGSTAVFTQPGRTTTINVAGSSSLSARFLRPESNRNSLSFGIRKASVYYVKRPGGGNLTITVSQEQMDDQQVTVDTSDGEGMGVFEVTPKSRAHPIVISLAAADAQVDVIGAVFWGDGGIVPWSSAKGGSSMSQQSASLDSGAFKVAFSEFFAELQTKLVVQANRVESGDTTLLPVFWGAYRSLGASLLTVSEPPLPVGDSGKALSESVNSYMREATRIYRIPFVDQAKFIGTYAEIEALGWHITELPSISDVVHLGGPHYRWLAALIGKEVNWFIPSWSGVTKSMRYDQGRKDFMQLGLLKACAVEAHPHGRSLTGAVSSGAGWGVTIDNERGVCLGWGANVGNAAARFALGSTGPAFYTAVGDMIISFPSYRGPGLQAGSRGFVIFGNTSTLAKPEDVSGGSRIFGVEFASGGDVGSPEGSPNTCVRLFNNYGGTLEYSSWASLQVPGDSNLLNVGSRFCLYWNKNIKSLLLYGSLSETGFSGGRSMRMLTSLHAPDMSTFNSNGAWIQVGGYAESVAPATARTNDFGFMQFSCVHMPQGAHPFELV
jgi:hypothetical protein